MIWVLAFVGLWLLWLSWATWRIRREVKSLQSPDPDTVGGGIFGEVEVPSDNELRGHLPYRDWLLSAPQGEEGIFGDSAPIERSTEMAWSDWEEGVPEYLRQLPTVSRETSTTEGDDS